MQIFAKSDIGKAREKNEDSFYVSTPEDEVKIYIVADGMGGYHGGEIASKLATISVQKYLNDNFTTINTNNKEEILELMKKSIEYANEIVYEKSQKDIELEGMGTTLEACLVYNNRVYIGHIGDSRVYRIRNTLIRKLTQDHSYVEKLVKDGTITKEQAQVHPKKNMLMKALGCTSYIEPDVMVKGFQKGDILVITSDGLTNMVSDEQICTIIRQDITTATQKLINLANDSGGYDNSTIIIIANN